MKTKDYKGITLIALIITIIILLILAGVSIAMVVGDNGILSQAVNASVATDVADTKEQIELALIGYYDENGKYTEVNVLSAVQDVLEDDASITENEDGTYTVTTEKENVVDITDIMNKAIAVISTEESFVGYYADVDGDGTVDGVIYVDLMHEQTAEYWSPGSTSSTYITYGTYSWDTIDSSKDYYVSQESYKGAFGTADVIRPVDGSTGNDRFYVMALSYFTTDDYTTFYWYYSAYNNRISDYSTVVSSDFGAGKENTETMISYWNNKTYGSQNVRDIWGLIQDEVNKGWFVPSRGELAAFNSELGRTRGTSSWTSSLSSAASACCDPVSLGYIYSTAINSTYSVRLSTIF